MPSKSSKAHADLPPPILIEDDSNFRELLRDLRDQDEIAIDTEADSFFNYREKVCLIQITVEDRDYLLDPLADFDLSDLGEILADPSKTKVFHDGEYDVLILKRDYGFDFAGLFDTRVAAAALGETNPGLASVLRDHFGVELDKSMQRSDWSHRPLSNKQIDYARLDTRYLIPLMHRQRAKLDEIGRMRIIEGECRRLEALAPTERVFNPDEFMRVKGARDLDPLGLRCLRELFVMRNAEAESRDRPPFKVLGNQLIIALANMRPRSMRELIEIPGLSPRSARRMGDAILGALESGVEQGPMTDLPHLPARDGTGVLREEEYELHDRLRSWRKIRAEKIGIDSSLILNRLVLLRLASERPKDRAELAAIEGLQEWQAEDFGQEVLDLIAKFEADVRAGRVEKDPRRRPRR